jgi:hypothetical protein
MDLHEKQQFDFLLNTAVERYIERLEQRNGGVEIALQRLRKDPEAEGIWLSRFTQAIFDDFLLNNAEGACFILKALAKRSASAVEAGKVETTLLSLARHTFADLLRQKTEEALEQRSSREFATAAKGDSL